MFGGNSGNAIAYYKNVTMKWMVSLGLWVISNPAISPKDVVYFGSEDAFMYAFNEDGRGSLQPHAQSTRMPKLPPAATFTLGSTAAGVQQMVATLRP